MLLAPLAPPLAFDRRTVTHTLLTYREKKVGLGMQSQSTIETLSISVRMK